MALRRSRSTLLASLVGLAACSGSTMPTEPSMGAQPTGAVPAAVTSPGNPVRISEFHYDNTGADQGEAVEIASPAGTSLTGWSLILYNGSGGAPYSTLSLGGRSQTVCAGGTRQVVVVSIPASSGIQNGSPDGLALIDAAGNVVEFLSYEGSFTAVGGAANGRVSTDIGVSQNGSGAIGNSLKRNAGGVFEAESPNNFGVCNDGNGGGAPPAAPVARVTLSPDSTDITVGGAQTFLAAALDAAGQPVPNAVVTFTSTDPAVATVTSTGTATGVALGRTLIIATSGTIADTSVLRVTAADLRPAIRIDELHYDNTGTDVDEAVVVSAPEGTNLDGWRIVLYNGNGGAAYGTTTLAGTVTNIVSGRGTRTVCYPVDGIQNGAPDGLALVNALGEVVEFLSYEGTMTAADGPAAGRVSRDIGAAQNNTPVGQSLQRRADDTWALGAKRYTCPPTIGFSGRTASDAPLPVGFEDQVFATLRASGVTVPTTFTWSSDTPAIATVDARGVVRGVSEGMAVIRATAADGTTGTVMLPIRVATASTSARYADHLDFGRPVDGDDSDDFLIRRTEYVSSFSRARNIPNWVAYNLEATHIGAEDRCDCFTYDPQLPADFRRYTTADYTGAGTAAGFGIDRGHLARSFDRTSGTLDNARTFYFSNIIPQAGDNNQGPWAQFENVLGDSARVGGREVFIVAGASGSQGTVKNEGLITIPEWTWKVAVILPRDRGVADVRNAAGITVLAVVMPNRPGIRNVPWQSYLVTVDSVEALSGYDVLANLPDALERGLEAGGRAPVAAAIGPFSGTEGGALPFVGSATDVDASETLTYAWSFGDGASATGPSVTHTYAQDGSYTVRLVVTDKFGLADTVTATAAIANVAPVVAALPGAQLLPGEFYRASGSFADPGADLWSGRATFGDGSPVQTLALTGKSFTLAHQYRTVGTFTVRVEISDDDATGSTTTSVQVISGVQALEQVLTLIRTAGGDKVPGLNGLVQTVSNAQRALERGDEPAALGLLNASLRHVDNIERRGDVPAATLAAIRTLLERVDASTRF